jgi:hypothetical protein
MTIWHHICEIQDQYLYEKVRESFVSES